MRKSDQSPTVLSIGRSVLLRGIARGDAGEFIALNRASRRLHRGWVCPPRTSKEFGLYLERSRQPHSLCTFICCREDGTILGAINLGQIVRGAFQNAYIGYFIGQPFFGKGHMTEALALILRVAFRTLKLHRLEANIQPANAASIALARRAGFRKEGFSRRYLKVCGRWRDHERWALVAEDWRAGQRHRRVQGKGQGRKGSLVGPPRKTLQPRR